METRVTAALVFLLFSYFIETVKYACLSILVVRFLLLHFGYLC